jgi:hypothetical protein
VTPTERSESKPSATTGLLATLRASISANATSSRRRAAAANAACLCPAGCSVPAPRVACRLPGSARALSPPVAAALIPARPALATSRALRRRLRGSRFRVGAVRGRAASRGDKPQMFDVAVPAVPGKLVIGREHGRERVQHVDPGLLANARSDTRPRRLADIAVLPSMYLSACTRRLRGRVHPRPGLPARPVTRRSRFSARKACIQHGLSSAPNRCIQDGFSAPAGCMSTGLIHASSLPASAAKRRAVPRRGAQHLGGGTRKACIQTTFTAPAKCPEWGKGCITSSKETT